MKKQIDCILDRGICDEIGQEAKRKNLENPFKRPLTRTFQNAGDLCSRHLPSRQRCPTQSQLLRPSNCQHDLRLKVSFTLFSL